MTRRGRPVKYASEEERRRARQTAMRGYRRAYRERTRGPSRFVGLDGEAIGPVYALLATADSAIVDLDGLDPERCRQFVWSQRGPGRILVAFGLSYDVAAWTGDLDDIRTLALWRGEWVEWGIWRMRYAARRMFELRIGRRRTVVYDVQAFFAGSFESALRQHLGCVPEVITRGKAARGDFATWPLRDVMEYTQTECRLLADLMDRMRDVLAVETQSGIRLTPGTWHGPGAVAARVLSHCRVGRAVRPERDLPPDLREAIVRSFFGGRIEALGVGTVSGTLWRYDIRSAYPAACRDLPALTWEWRYTRDYDPSAAFAVWHVRWDLRPFAHLLSWPGPLPWRDSTGRIVFRADAEGWYWSPEVRTALAHFPGVEVLHGWIMTENGEFPLREVVEELYHLRRQLILEGRPQQYAVKLAMNALYGKLAQTVGRPRWRSIAWAGYITAYTRAQLMEAAMRAPDGVLALLTDGILTRTPIPLDVGTDLGQWESSAYRACLILAPGVYRLEAEPPAPDVERWRGYPVRSFPWTRICEEVRQTGTASVECPMWVSPLLAVLDAASYGGSRGQFITIRRHITPLVTHKRRFLVPDDGLLIPAADLTRTWIPSLMVETPPGATAPLSAPYGAFEETPAEAELRRCLELTLSSLEP